MKLVFHKVLDDQNIFFFDMKNQQLQYVYKNKNDTYSCYISNTNMMQSKHDICFNKNVTYQQLERLVKAKDYNQIFK